MRLLVLSDTHFEFHKDHGEAFVDWIWNENKKSPPDAVVLAGDISDIDHLRTSIKMFAEKFRAVVFCVGNHEFYNTTPKNVLRKAERIESDFDNVYWLEPGQDTPLSPGEIEIDLRPDLEVDIHGGTLWFPDSKDDALKQYMNDFQCIYDFEPWVYEQHRITVEYLCYEIEPGDVVVTHHMPTEKSVHPRFKDDPLNPFFVSDLEWIINSRKPSIWIHGHTHSSFDYMIGDTRIICNPFGYARQAENKKFNPRLVIEV